MTTGTTQERPRSSRLLSMEQAARELRICTSTLRRLVKQGEIGFISIGLGEERVRRMFSEADIDAFVARRRRFECPSTDQREARSTTTISCTEVYDFMAQRAARRGARLSATKTPSAKPRKKR